MKPIAIFYHSLFQIENRVLPQAIEIITDQMLRLNRSGLLKAASEVYAGINGGEESEFPADCVLPVKALKVYHGLQCRNELRTLMLLQEVMVGRPDWLVLYFHSKGATRDISEANITNWRNCLMNNLVSNWRNCVDLLENGHDSVGCHWLTGQVDGTQNLWGGNFWWATSEFLATLPPIEKHPRIPLMGGIDSEQSRYEAEVWLGSGPKLPRVRDFHPGWPFNHRKEL